jgi:DNA-binding protein YbaB
MMRDYCISAANAAVNDWQKKKKEKEKKKTPSGGRPNRS